ncbi:MAG: hypothetical protein C4325_09890 [Blastocatellia bacterium]
MIRRVRDLAVFCALPKLRTQLHRARKLGLETLLEYPRLAMLLTALDLASALDGDVIEFGPYNGGSADLMLQNLPINKTSHLFDSFCGMPEVAEIDNFHKRATLPTPYPSP